MQKGLKNCTNNARTWFGECGSYYRNVFLTIKSVRSRQATAVVVGQILEWVFLKKLAAKVRRFLAQLLDQRLRMRGGPGAEAQVIGFMRLLVVFYERAGRIGG